MTETKKVPGWDLRGLTGRVPPCDECGEPARVEVSIGEQAWRFCVADAYRFARAIIDKLNKSATPRED